MTLGIALALIFGLWSLAPEGWPKMPTWAALLGVGAGVLLVGLAAGLVIGEQRRPIDPGDQQVFETSVYAFWQFPDAHSVPVEKKTKNIASWYALFTESIYVDFKDANNNSVGQTAVPPRWTMFILFEKPTRVRQMVAECKGPNSPTCLVQVNNEKYAIVTIVGEVTLATLEITTTPL